MAKEVQWRVANVKEHSGKANKLMLEVLSAAEKADTLCPMINTSTVDRLQCKKNLFKGLQVNTTSPKLAVQKHT